MIRVAQLLLVLAAIGLWVASRLPWVTLRTFDELGPERTTTLSGGVWSTALVPFAVLLLAAALAALAVRGWPLRVLALLVALVSAGSGYLAITLWTIPDVTPRAVYLVDARVFSLVESSRHFWGAVVTLGGALSALAAAVLLMRVAVKRSTKADKYVSPTRRRAVANRGESRQTMSERTMWDTLDEGNDPTRDSASEGR